jgi:hypothetical protein
MITGYNKTHTHLQILTHKVKNALTTVRDHQQTTNQPALLIVQQDTTEY